jgi:hypothetical protein
MNKLHKSVKKTSNKYLPINDLTLTKSQAKLARISSGIGSLRVSSNITLKGYKTGYHESGVATDTFDLLSKATAKDGGIKHTLHQPNPKSYFKKYHGHEVYSKTLKQFMELADGYRTDTAQTILSAPEGKVGGHAGSGINTKNQPYAHDTVREANIEILKLDPNTKGLSKRSIAVLLGAISIASVAPGELARKVKGGTATLKAGESAKQHYESNRNEAKARLDLAFEPLTTEEKAFVVHYSSEFLDGLESENNHKRYLHQGRSHSPFRSANSVTPSEVSGVGYHFSKSTLNPAGTLPPDEVNHTGLYITQPFRSDRRT